MLFLVLAWAMGTFVVECFAQETTKAVKRPAKVSILNVSYDPTREFYQEFNRTFADYWKERTGQEVTVEQSHGGSGKQTRAVIDGLDADVVTLALAHDIDTLAKKGLVKTAWQIRLPHNSSPYTSTIVFLVRKGNPKKIHDWDDLVRKGVSVVAANPKTGGGARWNYLAAWGFSLKKELGDLAKLSDPTQSKQVAAAQAKARQFVGDLYRNMPVMDSGARGATNTFVQREIGDALLCWENEAFLAIQELGKDKIELVVPSVSILAEPPVAVVDKVVDKRGTREVAEEYVKYLYSPTGQRLAAKYFYRPLELPKLSAEEQTRFSRVKLFTIDEVFGGWEKAQAEHFNDGGVFDQFFVNK